MSKGLPFLGVVILSHWSLSEASAQQRSIFDENPAEHLQDLSSPEFEAKPDISADLLTLRYASAKVGTLGSLDLWETTRTSPGDAFGASANLTELNSDERDHTPTTTGDDLEIIYSSSRLVGGLGSDDAWMATRPDTSSAWSAPVNLTSLNSSDRDMGFSVTPDGLCLYYTSNRPGEGEFDLYMATRPNRTSDWTSPVPIAGLNTIYNEKFPSVTGDNLTLYCASDRPGCVPVAEGTTPSLDIWVAMRPDTNSPWTVIENVAEVNTEHSEYLMSIANDESELFFVSDRPGSLGGFDLYRSMAVPGVKRYGAALAGGAGIPRMRSIGGAPTIGNTDFAFELVNIPQNASVLYWASLFPNTDPALPILVGPPFTLRWIQFANSNPGVSDPLLIPAPVPNDTVFIGLTAFCQSIALDPNGTGQVGNVTFGASNGVRRTVLP